MLTEEMKSIIRTYPVGFVASVNADGTPNLSPKGTFVVLNDTQLAFGHIRSPGTIGNIAERPMIEVNFLDVLSRKAVRLRGRAKMFSKGAPEFGQLLGALEPDAPRRLLMNQSSLAKTTNRPSEAVPRLSRASPLSPPRGSASY
jgi:Pyridoxamine 5'-phosphate oxidase